MNNRELLMLPSHGKVTSPSLVWSTLETALLQACIQALRLSRLTARDRASACIFELLRALPSLDVHLGSASGKIAFHQIHYRSCDLLAAPRRRFYRIGVITFFGADQSQID